MIDLQVIKVRDVLSVIKVTLAAMTPRTLLLEGKDFSCAEEVYVNEIRSPSVVIVDDRNLLTQVPDSELNTPIRSVSVISSKLTRNNRSKIDFKIGNISSRASGIERLVQMFLKIMMQTPGTDIFVPASGGGLLRAVGKTAGKNDQANIVADFHNAVSMARQQIMRMQANSPPTTLSERLLYARPLDVKFVTQELALVGKIDIANQAGKSAVVGLVT